MTSRSLGFRRRTGKAATPPSRHRKRRRRSLIAEPMAMPEHAELGDVALEEKRDGPVGDHPELPRNERELVEVVRPRDEPTEEAAELEAQHLGDALAPAQGRDLAEHPVAVGLRLAA